MACIHCGSDERSPIHLMPDCGAACSAPAEHHAFKPDVNDIWDEDEA